MSRAERNEPWHIMMRLREDDNGCWLYERHTDDNGYGFVSYRATMRRVHVLVYEWEIGPVPEGLELDHLCRVRNCANPAHLEPVTHAENMRRGVSEQASRTHCPAGHEYTEANTYRRPRTGHRTCRTCEKRRHSPSRYPPIVQPEYTTTIR